jgi:hypothetical protein
MIGYLQLVRVKGLVSSSNSESQAGGSITTNRVSQAGQVKRVGTRRSEYQEEENFDKIRLMMEAASIVTT